MTIINLLPEKSRLKLAQLAVVRRLRRFIFIFLMIFIVWSAAVLMIDIYLATQLKSTLAKLDSAKLEIDDLLPKINLQYQARSQVRRAAEVLQERIVFSPLIEAFYALVGEGAAIKKFEYQKGEIALEGYWPGLTSLAEFEKKVSGLSYKFGEVEFQIISAESLSLSDQKVSFNLKIRSKK